MVTSSHERNILDMDENPDSTYTHYDDVTIAVGPCFRSQTGRDFYHATRLNIRNIFFLFEKVGFKDKKKNEKF